MAGKKKTKVADIKDDPRVVALAECVLFAINNVKNKPVLSGTKVEMMHAWFKRALTDAGYVVSEGG